MSDQTTGPDREMRAEAVVEATPERVWELLSVPANIASWSEETLWMWPLRPGGMREGQWYLGINRRKAVVWPTRSVVAVLEHGRRLAWDTVSSGARWIWDVAPGERVGTTHVVHRRVVSGGLTLGSKLFAGALLGGAAGHADELEQQMAGTVDRLRLAAEAA